MKEFMLAIVFGIVLGGCAAAKVGVDGRTTGGNDGYVPWWVEDGVPNSEGVIVR